jgi:hypothetical protein
MSTWTRKISAGLLALVLAVGLGCSTGEAPTEPATQSPGMQSLEGQPEELILGDLLKAITDLRLLSCSPQPYASKTQTVGSAGGTIVVGTHRLVIPAGALRQPVTIRAEQVTSRVNSVRFHPEGLRFDRPASLTMSYSNCSPLMLLKKVVYTNELLSILELLPSVDNLKNKTVTGTVRHFSRYAVAW